MATRTSGEIDGPAIPRRWLVQEVWLVFGLSLGASGVNALLHLLADLTNGKALRAQTALLNGSQAPGRPWLDLALQLTGIAFGLVPVLLVAHFLLRSDESLHDIGADFRQPRWDAARGALVAAAVGGRRPRVLPDRARLGGQPHGRARGPAEGLVAHPRPDPVGGTERHGRGSAGPRLPDPPAEPAGMDLRRAPWSSPQPYAGATTSTKASAGSRRTSRWV